MRVLPSSSFEDQCLDFLLSAWSQRHSGDATSPKTLQFTQPKVDKPKSLLWWAKPLNTKFICKNKQVVARVIHGGPPSGRSAFWKRKKKLHLRLSGAAIKATRSTQNIKLTSAILSCHGNAQHRTCAQVIVWVALFTISDLGRSCTTNLHAFAARSRLITADKVWSLAAYAGPWRADG